MSPLSHAAVCTGGSSHLRFESEADSTHEEVKCNCTARIVQPLLIGQYPVIPVWNDQHREQEYVEPGNYSTKKPAPSPPESDTQRGQPKGGDRSVSDGWPNSAHPGQNRPGHEQRTDQQQSDATARASEWATCSCSLHTASSNLCAPLRLKRPRNQLLSLPKKAGWCRCAQGVLENHAERRPPFTSQGGSP
jgi:hypothetical protein